MGQVPKDELKRLIARTTRAASRDTSRAVLNGVRFKADPDGLEGAATDSYRLTVARIPWNGEVWGPEIIDRKDLEGLKFGRSSWYGAGVDVELNGSFAISGPGVKAGQSAAIVADVEFPNVAQLIPSGYETRVTFDAGELAAFLEPFADVVGDKAPLMLDFDPKGCSAWVDHKAFGRLRLEYRPELVSVQGTPVVIAFNHGFFMDALETMGGMVRLDLSGALKPAMFTHDDSGDLVHLLMPVRMS